MGDAFFCVGFVKFWCGVRHGGVPKCQYGICLVSLCGYFERLAPGPSALGLRGLIRLSRRGEVRDQATPVCDPVRE